MDHVVPIGEARARMGDLIAEADQQEVYVLRHGRPAGVILSATMCVTTQQQVHTATPRPPRQGVCVTVMTVPRARCEWSDLHRDECAHCVGDDGTPPVFVADPPARHRAALQRLRAILPPVRPAGPAAPSTITPTFHVLCALNEDCRDTEHGGPRQTGGRSHVCPACEDRTRDNLHAVADAWPDLQARLTAIRALAHADLVTGDTPGTGIVLDEAASDAMREAGLRAHFYTRVVMRERGHTPPDATPVGLLRWLARNHVPWLCAHPDQDLTVAFLDDAGDLARQAKSAAYPAGWRTIPIPLDCGQPVPDDPDDEHSTTTPCAGRMTARIRPDLHRLPDLVCDTRPEHVIPPGVWQRAGWKRSALHEDATRRFLNRLQT